jgi:hypothetical protein
MTKPAATSSPASLVPIAVRTLFEGIERMKTMVPSDPFTFLVNGSRFETDVMNAVLLSPAVHSQILHDRTVDSFVIDDDSVTVQAFSMLNDILSGGSVTLSMAERKPMLTICRSLRTRRLETLILAASFGCSSSTTLDILGSEEQVLPIDPAKVYLFSKSDLSLLPVQTLFELFSSDSLVVQTEVWLFDFIFSLRESGYSLLGCVRFEFLNPDAIS